MTAIAKWGTPGSGTVVLSSEMDGIGPGTFSTLGPAYDNATLLNLYVNIEFRYTFNTFVNPRRFFLYYLPTLDGTNYADLKLLHRCHRLCVFDVGQQASARIIKRNVLLPPLKGKFAMHNYHNNTFDGNAGLGSGQNFVTVYPANVNLQG